MFAVAAARAVRRQAPATTVTPHAAGTQAVSLLVVVKMGEAVVVKETEVLVVRRDAARVLVQPPPPAHPQVVLAERVKQRAPVAMPAVQIIVPAQPIEFVVLAPAPLRERRERVRGSAARSPQALVQVVQHVHRLVVLPPPHSRHPLPVFPLLGDESVHVCVEGWATHSGAALDAKDGLLVVEEVVKVPHSVQPQVAYVLAPWALEVLLDVLVRR
jgi:hypothetical protein